MANLVRRQNGLNAMQMIRKDMEIEHAKKMRRVDEERQMRRMMREHEIIQRKLNHAIESLSGRKRLSRKEKERLDKRDDFIRFTHQPQKEEESESDPLVGDELRGSSISSD